MDQQRVSAAQTGGDREGRAVGAAGALPLWLRKPLGAERRSNYAQMPSQGAEQITVTDSKKRLTSQLLESGYFGKHSGGP